MNKLMVVLVAACAANAFAMPTKDELKKAQPLVAELMAPKTAEFKDAGAKDKAAAAAKVGDASVEFAKAAETEAAKFLFLKGAVSYYARGEQYEKAADAMAMLQREVKDIPPAVIAEIAGKATGKISETKAPRLYAIYNSAKLQVKAGEEAKTLAAKLKKAKSDVFQRKYAEALAISGNWKAAYAEFAKVTNPQLKAMATAEAAGKAKNAEAGEFWWDYKPLMEEADDFFKSHAAAFYSKALAAGEITGLKKNLIEQRINGITAEISPTTTESQAPVAQPATKDDEKFYLEVVAAIRKNGGDSAEKTKTVFSKLFPGWSTSHPSRDELGGFAGNHRGKNNVYLSHPINQETPEIISREVKLSGKNPCLFLNISSFGSSCDCLLAVRVNDKYALPTKRICTPDSVPWEDIIVPLSDWNGQTVKIEIIHSANDWWCEHLFFSRIEIAEAKGDMRVIDGQAKVGAYTWSFRVQNGEATIVAEKNGKFSCAVSPTPKGAIAIPTTISGAKTTRIGMDAFAYCNGITSATIPKGITRLDQGVFYNCHGLKSVQLPEGLTTIGTSAFNTTSIGSIKIPKSVAYIGPYAFCGCTQLTSVELPPSGMERICDNCFLLCKGLRTFTIPASVKHIEAKAFGDCEALESVTLLGEKPEAAADAFSKCGKLKAIHVSAKAKSWAGLKEWLGIPLVFDAK